MLLLCILVCCLSAVVIRSNCVFLPVTNQNVCHDLCHRTVLLAKTIYTSMSHIVELSDTLLFFMMNTHTLDCLESIQNTHAILLHIFY